MKADVRDVPTTPTEHNYFECRTCGVHFMPVWWCWYDDRTSGIIKFSKAWDDFVTHITCSEACEATFKLERMR